MEKEDDSIWPVLNGVVMAVVAVGGFFVLTGGFRTRTCGGTQSCRLKWEQRSVEIDRTVSGPVGPSSANLKS